MRKHLRTLSLGLLVTVFVVSYVGMPIVAHGSISSIITDLALWLPGLIIGRLIMPMMSLLVYVSGMLLNWSVQYSVLDMKANYAAVHIDDVWTVMRDLANMGFIFVLLYTSIMTIFGQAKWRETIVKIVIAALLINFSLLITKAVIDASNVLALLFYNAISPGVNATNAASVGISTSFMDALGIQNLYSATTAFDGTKMAIIGVAGTVIYLISAFTFLAVALMFIIRFVVLLFVVALSPLIFVGSIFPNAGGYGKQWRDALLNQAFFAPVYFMLTWVTLKVAQGLNHGGGNIAGVVLGKEVNGVATADPNSVGVLMRFVIIIGLLVISLVQAKKMAEKSSGGATKWAMGLAGGASIGAAGRFGRGTIGRAGAAISNSEAVKNAIDKGGAAGMAGRLAMFAGNKSAKSSFDLRAAPGLGGALGKLDAGKVKKGTSFEQDVKNRTKAAVDRANYLKPSDAVLKEAREKNEKAREAYDKELKDAGYNKPPELESAETEYKASFKRQKNESDEDWAERKEEAKKKYDAAKAADAPEREAVLTSNPALAAFKAEADEAEAAFKHVDERPERFIADQSRPTLDAIPVFGTKADRIAIENVNRKGIGGALAASPAADAIRNSADKVNEHISKLPWYAKILAAPTIGLAASTAKAGVTALGLRQAERDARVEAIRKERKKKKDPNQEELIRALKESKGDGGSGGGEDKKTT